jgi:lysophospholipase L1-like esterase
MKHRHLKLFFVLPALALCLALGAGLACGSENGTLAEWAFDREQDLKGWTPNGQISEIEITGGKLSCRTVGDDPILELQSPLDIAATPRQFIEVGLKADHSGMAEFFWSNTREGRYGGFSGEKHTQFQVVGDGQWHVYRIFPFWQTEGKIVRLRFDLFGSSRFSIQSIRIAALPSSPPSDAAEFDFARGLGNWMATGALSVSNTPGGLPRLAGSTDDFLMAPPVAVKTDDKSYVSIRMRTIRGKKARLIFATDKTPGMHALNFPIKADGQERVYNLDMLASPDWKDTVIAIGLQLADDPGASAALRSLSIAADPQGPPQLSVIAFCLDEAAPRAGIPGKIVARIVNTGGEATAALRASLSLPDGIRLASAPKPDEFPARLGCSEEAVLSWTVECSQPASGIASLVLSADNAESVTNQAAMAFTARPQLPKASYVPEPKPVRGKYDVGAYYFPGWQSRSQWQPIERFPERKPILGWYREGDPEVADWHIKWAVEHGITFFAYDWYWSRGARQLEHGLHNGYFKARYKSMLPFCLLWANHNAPKTHSLEDSLAVARYWIANYFNRPEYYRIGGKPVVIVFSPYNYKNDMGVAGVNQAFEAMRGECRKAGLPGLYLAACVGNARQVEGENYDAVTAYNWPSLGVSGSENQAPYAGLLPSYRQQWSQLLQEDSHAVMLPLCGGWDSRPWHGDAALVRTGRNPEFFKRHLQDAREFLETNSTNSRLLPSVLIEAWNEWGEGSYIEPHKEFGFGYLDAIRDVFADAPAAHADLAPVDVGMGPYDLPAAIASKTNWQFENDSADWKNTMDLDRVRIESGALTATSVGNDPAFFSPPFQARASEFSHVFVRMRLTPVDGSTEGDIAQLFWSSKRWPESEASSLRFPVSLDGQWHDYELPVKDNRRWKGFITRLRLDPVNRSGVRAEIRQISLKPIATAALHGSDNAVSLALAGDWQLRVSGSRFGSNITVSVEPPVARIVVAELYERLPPFNSNAGGGWTKGAPLRGLIAQECTTPGLLDPASLSLRAGAAPDSMLFEPGKDYGVDPAWGTIGRLPGGRIAQDQPVFASYRHGLLRIDSLTATPEGRLVVRRGEPRSAAPRPPLIEAGETVLANIWIPGQISKLTQDHLFPILETAFPTPAKPSPSPAETLLPKTMAKLRQGSPVRVLAWGDSVTDGSFLPQGLAGRWQNRFAAQLQSRFPNAKIELITEAWGGRNTTSYLQEPPGSPHNYKEKVLGAKPDLIVSEFVNDAGLTPDEVEQRYSRLLADFQGIDAEWIVLTPHYVRPDWMGLTKERDCDEDPRPYVKGLRQFAAKHGVALADASLRFGRLWRQGIPYNTLMLNSINHPDDRGMNLFADAILELFP